jgi:hypothetical protein
MTFGWTRSSRNRMHNSELIFGSGPGSSQVGNYLKYSEKRFFKNVSLEHTDDFEFQN